MIFADNNVGLLEKLMGEVVDVSLIVDDLLYPGIDEDLGAHRAGERRGVDRGAVDAHAEVRRLRDGVLLGMDASAQLVPSARRYVHLLSDASHLLAVAGALGRTVVSGGENPLVLDDDGSDLPSQTGGSGRYQTGHLHEILVIAGSVHGGCIAEG